MTSIVRRDGHLDIHFRSHDAATRWAEANLEPGTYSIESSGSGCCG